MVTRQFTPAFFGNEIKEHDDQTRTCNFVSAGNSFVSMKVPEKPTDEDIVKRILQGETALYEVLIQRYNQRLYRISRTILRDDTEARDVVQHTFAHAYEHLNQFAGRAKFSTWLTTIAVHEASLRKRRQRRMSTLEELESVEGRSKALVLPAQTPEQQVTLDELKGVLESALDALPEKYRLIVVMRDIEAMTTSETAECLGISEQSAKVQLHRGRALLRKRLYELVGSKASEIFRFGMLHCDRVVHRVLRATELLPSTW